MRSCNAKQISFPIPELAPVITAIFIPSILDSMKYATLPWACYISKAYAKEAQRRFLLPKQRYSSLNTELSIAYSKYNLNLFSELSNYIHHFMNSSVSNFMCSSVEYFVGYIHCKMRKTPAFSVKTDSKEVIKNLGFKPL